MKKIILALTFGITGCFYANAQVGIGTTSPNPSSMLDVNSTTSGLLVPRMTSAQRVAITNPATGLMVFQTNGTPGIYYNTGSTSSPNWIFAGSSTGQWLTNGSSIYYNNGNVGIGTTAPGNLFSIKNTVLSSDFVSFINGTDDLVARIRYAGNGSGVFYLYDAAGANTVFLYGEGNSWLRGGRLALGHTSPLAGLHLKGSAFPESFIYMEGSAGIDAGLRLYENGTAKWHLYNDVGNDGLTIMNNAGNIVLFARQTNGYVGIGTTNPSTLLNVNGNLSVTGGGRLGIGTTNPLQPLHVAGNATVMSGSLGVGTTAPGAGLHVKGTAFPASFIFVESGTGSDAGIRLYEGTTAKWHAFHDATANGLHIYNSGVETAIFAKDDNAYVGIGHTAPERPLDVKGNMVVRNGTTNDIVVELGTGLDYAEGFNTAVEESPEPGTVMSIDPDHPGMLMVCNSASDRKVAGIVAGANNLGSGIVLGSGSHQVNVALAGRVYCNVETMEMAVEAGDLLTTSSIAGFAKRADPGQKVTGAILGKAMEGLPKGQKGKILVLVTLQ